MADVVQVYDGTGDMPDSLLQQKSLHMYRTHLAKWVKSLFICVEAGGNRRRLIAPVARPFRFYVMKTSNAILTDEWWQDGEGRRCLFPFWKVNPDKETKERFAMHKFPAHEVYYFWYPRIWYPDGTEVDPHEQWEKSPANKTFKEIP